MRFQTETSVLFDSLEFQTLKRVEPSVRVGFPTDELDALTRGGASERVLKEARRGWAGRHLAGVCSRRDLFPPDFVHAALDELRHLIVVLGEQSTREYWEAALKPEHVDTSRRSERSAAVALVAPGTDVCGTLAEARAQMLRNAEEALPVLAKAAKGVGPRPESVTATDSKYEGV